MRAVWWAVLVLSVGYGAVSLYGNSRAIEKCEARGGAAARSAKLTGGTVCVKELK